jgi:uncharacterized protein
MKQIFTYVAIPTENFERAFQFYSAITGGLMIKNENVPFPMAYFMDEDKNNVGHLFQLPDFRPSADGSIVYLELAKDLSETLAKIEVAGGYVIMPKTLIAPGKGYWALFLDTEGNKLALHSINLNLSINN